MENAEKKGSQVHESRESGAEGMSRRAFVERLRQSAIFVAPLVVALSLKTPKATASPY